MAKTDKPPQMTMLETKGVYARDYFRFRGTPDACYAVTRSWQFIGLDGEAAALSEDEIWERYDDIERISRTEYEGLQAEYRDRIWRARGQPDARELEALAPAFLDEYCNRHADGRWKAVCRYDEETLRRLLDRAVEALAPEGGARERQKKYQQMYKDLVLAKAALAAGREASAYR